MSKIKCSICDDTGWDNHDGEQTYCVCRNGTGEIESEWTKEAPKEDCLIQFVTQKGLYGVGETLTGSIVKGLPQDETDSVAVIYVYKWGKHKPFSLMFWVKFKEIKYWSRNPIAFPPAPEGE